MKKIKLLQMVKVGVNSGIYVAHLYFSQSVNI